MATSVRGLWILAAVPLAGLALAAPPENDPKDAAAPA